MIFPLICCRNRPRFTWLWLAVLSFSGSVFAGEYSVTTWGVDEGLPQSSVTDIAQTSDGLLWIRTLSSGLARYDGFQFVGIDSANLPGLGNLYDHRLMTDSQGNLWINDTLGNLIMRQGNNFVKLGENLGLCSLLAGTLIGEQEGHVALTTLAGKFVLGVRNQDGQWSWRSYPLPSTNANYVCHEDKVGGFWLLAPDGTLSRFFKGKFESIQESPGIVGSRIQSLARDTTGRIWLGTDKGLMAWDNGTFTNLNPGGAGATVFVRRITPSPDGSLWLEADGKLVRFDQDGWSKPVPEWDDSRPPWSHHRGFHSDNLGGLWISLADEGLVHVSREGRLARVTSADGLPSQLVQTFIPDFNGNLWAGYHRGGLVQLRQQTFHSVTRREGLLNTIVTSVAQAADGAILIGTAGGSLARWADGICTNFSLPLRGKFCQDVVVASGLGGRVWIGTGGNGLLVLEKGEFRHAIPPDQMPQEAPKVPQSIRQLVVAKNGDVWFANSRGIYQFDGKKLELVVPTDSTGQSAASLVQAADGAMWFGTFGGVLRRWQDGKLKSYQPQDKVASSRFWALYPEDDGTIWVGTLNAGLLRFKDGEFMRFTTADGLADDGISHILKDDKGNLWLGSRVGVMCVPESALFSRFTRKEPVTCRLFGRSDGLPTVALTLEFHPSCVKAADGSLWFGSPKGASCVNPAFVRPIEAAPRVLLESVLADNLPQEFFGTRRGSASREITVEPDVKNVEVRFTAPVFTAPDLTRFKYRLDPLDADWVNLGARRNVSFPHLPAGEYTFRASACNSDGLCSGEPTAFRLVVKPHLWERTSFQAATLMGLLSVVGLAVRGITQQRLRRKLELLRQQQQIERERARIAQDLHDDLGAGLTQISMTSDLVENPDLPEHEKIQYAHEVGLRARELVQRMDEIVWAVNPRNDSFASLSLYASQYAKQFLELFNISCRVELEPGMPEILLNAEQRYSFFLAFKEAVSNIARHSGATELHLAIKADNGNLVFIIEDNGKGFEFGGEQPGADGLRNIRERIDRMGGECEIKSRPGEGTRVYLRVPLAGSP